MSKLVNVLLAAGWTPGRTVNAAVYAERAREAGFEVNEAALAFFREFGGLRVPLPAQGEGAYLDLTLRLCPSLPLVPFMADFDRRYGPLTPVAVEMGGNGPLLCPSYMVAPQGDLLLFNNCLGNEPEWDEVIWGPWTSGADMIAAAMGLNGWPELWRKA